MEEKISVPKRQGWKPILDGHDLLRHHSNKNRQYSVLLISAKQHQTTFWTCYNSKSKCWKYDLLCCKFSISPSTSTLTIFHDKVLSVLWVTLSFFFVNLNKRFLSCACFLRRWLKYWVRQCYNWKPIDNLGYFFLVHSNNVPWILKTFWFSMLTKNLCTSASSFHSHLQLKIFSITALLTPHLCMLSQGVHLPSSLSSNPLCKVPLIRPNTHLQPSIEALFRVGMLLIQPALYQRLWSGHGRLPWKDRSAAESYLKALQSEQHVMFCIHLRV